MSQISTILLGVSLFSLIILMFVAVILVARSKLVPCGHARLTINDDPARTLTVSVGDTLLNVLSQNNINLPCACGGRGICGKCIVAILAGGMGLLPAEELRLTRRQIHQHYRLSCQVRVKADMKLVVPVEALAAHKWECTVRSNHNVASFIKELVLELPDGKDFEFRAGSYVQTEAPPHTVHYADFVIEEEYRPPWDRDNLWQYVSVVDKPVSRAYSIASYPDEKGLVILNVALAPPPPNEPQVPPGKMSSYLFSLKPGDKLIISGPYGSFFAQQSDNEMIFVGGVLD
jgi:Na+-transporting NADH:ubiquinone oxidoreductase subunit F